MFVKYVLASLLGAAIVMGTMGAATAAPTPTPPIAAFGWNDRGQLGDGTTADTKWPVAVDASGELALRSITAISAAGGDTCVVADGSAFCWGDNSYGQLGNNTAVDSPVPVAVTAAAGTPLSGKTVTAIAAGGDHTCAVADGAAYCWGHNAYGQLGIDSTTDSLVPVAVIATPGAPLSGKTVTAITADESHTCAIADGKAYCWGDNAYGQLGIDSTTDSLVPIAVTATPGTPLFEKTVTTITAAGDHTCLAAEGHAYCWGWNGFGQVGNGDGAPSVVPAPVAVRTLMTGMDGRTVQAIAAGAEHTCAVASGAVFCWGWNAYKQLGGTQNVPNATVPQPVDASGSLAGQAVTGIAAGNGHSCAVASSAAYCWGSNAVGQLGDGTNIMAPVPVAVSTTGVLSDAMILGITAGANHTVLTAAVPPVRVPRPPSGVAGTAGDTRVMVSWTAPDDDGGAPVLGYTATASPGGLACTTGTTSCEVAGLTNGTSYTFTVTARNAKGVSAQSAPSAPVTPVAATTSPTPVQPLPPAPVQPLLPAPVQPLQTMPPGRVTGVKVASRNGTVRITWMPVQGASSYRVRISKPGGTKYRAWKTTTNRLFKAKVRKGKKYQFLINAVGVGGRGPVTTIWFRGK